MNDDIQFITEKLLIRLVIYNVFKIFFPVTVHLSPQISNNP